MKILDYIKAVIIFAIGIGAFKLGGLRSRNRELEKEDRSNKSRIKQLEKNAKVEKIISDTSFSEFSNELLKEQRNHSNK